MFCAACGDSECVKVATIRKNKYFFKAYTYISTIEILLMNKIILPQQSFDAIIQNFNHLITNVLNILYTHHS